VLGSTLRSVSTLTSPEGPKGAGTAPRAGGSGGAPARAREGDDRREGPHGPGFGNTVARRCPPEQLVSEQERRQSAQGRCPANEVASSRKNSSVNLPGCRSGSRCHPLKVSRHDPALPGVPATDVPGVVVETPAVPYTNPRAGTAISSPNGVTRFCSVIDRHHDGRRSDGEGLVHRGGPKSDRCLFCRGTLRDRYATVMSRFSIAGSLSGGATSLRSSSASRIRSMTDGASLAAFNNESNATAT